MNGRWKIILLILIALATPDSRAQNIQLHYDFRHSIDPERFRENFGSMYFEYFRTLDTGSFFIKPGSFLVQMKSDFNGDQHNIGNFYMMISQSFRCWKPKVFIHLEYSGGLGIAEPGSYAYYIANGFSAGASHLVSWKGGFYNFAISYRYNAFATPSHDAMFSFYWWKGLFHYKMEFSGDVETWTQNRNRGDSFTAGLSGKKISLFGQPQVWYNMGPGFSIGSKVYLYYHVLTDENILQAYPTLAVKYKLSKS